MATNPTATPDQPRPDAAMPTARDVIAEWHYNDQMEITDCPWEKLSDEHRERHSRWSADPCLSALAEAGFVVVDWPTLNYLYDELLGRDEPERDGEWYDAESRTRETLAARQGEE